MEEKLKFVKLRDGNKYLMTEKVLIGQDDNYLFVENYDGYSHKEGISELDIVEVYECLSFGDMTEENLIWRETPRKSFMTFLEYKILRCIDRRYNWLARDKNGELHLFEDKPVKWEGYYWDGTKMRANFPIVDIFGFINWEDDEPYKIRKEKKI